MISKKSLLIGALTLSMGVVPLTATALYVSPSQSQNSSSATHASGVIDPGTRMAHKKGLLSSTYHGNTDTVIDKGTRMAHEPGTMSSTFHGDSSSTKHKPDVLKDSKGNLYVSYGKKAIPAYDYKGKRLNAYSMKANKDDNHQTQHVVVHHHLFHF